MWFNPRVYSKIIIISIFNPKKVKCIGLLKCCALAGVEALDAENSTMSEWLWLTTEYRPKDLLFTDLEFTALMSLGPCDGRWVIYTGS